MGSLIVVYSKAVPLEFTVNTCPEVPKELKPVPPFPVCNVPVTFVVRFIVGVVGVEYTKDVEIAAVYSSVTATTLGIDPS